MSAELLAAIAGRIQRVESGCLEWTGALHPDGHGRVKFNGHQAYVHRLVYETLVAPVPPGHVVHHECGNPRCLNPHHLAAMSRKAHAAEHGTFGQAAVHASRTHCQTCGDELERISSTQRGCRRCKRRHNREYEQRVRGRAA